MSLLGTVTDVDDHFKFQLSFALSLCTATVPSYVEQHSPPPL